MHHEWDNLAEDVDEDTVRRGPNCAVQRMFKKIPEQHQESVRALLEDNDVPASALHRALAKRLGKDAPSRVTIGRHRRGECRCDRED